MGSFTVARYPFFSPELLGIAQKHMVDLEWQIMAKLPRKIVGKLESALRAARLENASFAFPHEYVVACDENGRPWAGAKPERKDAYVKEAVRLYLNSWVAAPIVSVLAWARGE